MNLFTKSGIKVNAIKLTDTFINSHDWVPHSFSVDGIPMTAITAPTGKASQYRFMWNAEWYRIPKSALDLLPQDECMIFFTVDPVKEEVTNVDGNMFITITQFPDVKGLFVGTTLRAAINKDKEAICNFRDNQITVNKDSYLHAHSMEIFGYFSQHFNKLVYVKKTKEDTGEITEIINVRPGKSGNLYAAVVDLVAGKDTEVQLSYVYDPTDEQLLQYYLDDATNKQFVPTAIVSYDNNQYKIRGYKLNSRKQLEVLLESANKQVSVLLDKISLVHEVLPTGDGEELARHFIANISKGEFLAKLDSNVAKSFFNTVKEWCDNHLDEVRVHVEISPPTA